MEFILQPMKKLSQHLIIDRSLTTLKHSIFKLGRKQPANLLWFVGISSLNFRKSRIKSNSLTSH